MTILEPTLSLVHLGNNDPLKIRVALEYSDSMRATSMYEIHTIDASGNQLVVPIENENREVVLLAVNRWIPTIPSQPQKMVWKFILLPMSKIYPALPLLNHPSLK